MLGSLCVCVDSMSSTSWCVGVHVPGCLFTESVSLYVCLVCVYLDRHLFHAVLGTKSRLFPDVLFSRMLELRAQDKNGESWEKWLIPWSSLWQQNGLWPCHRCHQGWPQRLHLGDEPLSSEEVSDCMSQRQVRTGSSHSRRVRCPTLQGTIEEQPESRTHTQVPGGMHCDTPLPGAVFLQEQWTLAAVDWKDRQ